MDKGSQPSGCLGSSSVTIHVKALSLLYKAQRYFLDNYRSRILTPKTDISFGFTKRQYFGTFSPPLAEYLPSAWTENILSFRSCLLSCWYSNIMSRNPFFSGSNLSTLVLKLTCWNRRRVLGSESSGLLKRATCLSSAGPTIVKCLLTFSRAQGPFPRYQVFVWVKNLLCCEKRKVLWGNCGWILENIHT